MHFERKSTVSPDLLKAEFYNFLSHNMDSFHIYTDGSKDGNAVAAAAVCSSITLSCRLSAEASIFTAEAQAILLALNIIDSSSHSKYLILSDSMSCLQAIHHRKVTNPHILQILEKCQYIF